MVVGRHERSDVGSSGQVGGSQRTVAPRQGLSLEVSDEGNVRHHPGMSAIAVPEGMHRHDAVVQAHGELFWRIGLLFQPSACVVIDVSEVLADLVVRNADV
jgi:hypothetical protein